MKPSLLSYVVFILLIITNGDAAASEDSVYDINGKKVLNNVPYYLGPVIRAKGGGIKLTDTIKNKKICPSYVVQDPAEVNKGDQFNFTLLANQKYLHTSYPLGIRSRSATGSCDALTFWKISNPEAKAPSNLITTGGSLETAISCFRVVDYPKPTSAKVHSYMLQLCPWVCGAGPRTCFNISLYEDKGVRYLASSGTPFEFVFRKAK